MHMLRHGRAHARQRPSFPTILMACLVVSALFYIFYFRLRELYYDHEAFGDGCRSEFTNMKYQLENALESNSKQETVISNLQRDCMLQTESVRQLFENYNLMKKHLDNCERQAEEFEIECKDLNIKLQEAKEELSACKKTPTPG